MKGAATGELAASIMNAERITSTISIGASQYFFRTFKKSQNSFTRDINHSSVQQCESESELFLVSLNTGLRRIFPPYPVRRCFGVAFPIHWVLTYQAHNQACGSDHKKKYDC